MSCTTAGKKGTATLVELCLCVTGSPMHTVLPMESRGRKPHGKVKQILVPKTFVSLKIKTKQNPSSVSELMFGHPCPTILFHCTTR